MMKGSWFYTMDQDDAEEEIRGLNRCLEILEEEHQDLKDSGTYDIGLAEGITTIHVLIGELKKKL